MNVFWCRCGSRHGNFGDELTSVILDYLGVPHAWSAFESADFVGIGSVLNQVPDGYNGVIWTSGAMYPGDRRPLSSAKVIAVRGKLSLGQLSCTGMDDIALGDGGLLCYLFQRPTHKQFKVGVIPHYRQVDDPAIVGLRTQPHIRIIDICDHPLSIIRNVSECEHIVSSSLHGLILADSLEIPNTWIELETTRLRMLGDHFKFRDYYSIYDMHAVQPVQVTQSGDFNELFPPTGYVRPGIKERQQILLDCLWKVVGPYSSIPTELATLPIVERERLVLDRLNGTTSELAARCLVNGFGQAAPIRISSVPLRGMKKRLRSDRSALARFFTASLQLMSELKQQRVVHGDIREDNVFVTDNEPLLANFGWRVADSDHAPNNLSSCASLHDKDVYDMGTLLDTLSADIQPYCNIAHLLTYQNSGLRLRDASVALSLVQAYDDVEAIQDLKETRALRFVNAIQYLMRLANAQEQATAESMRQLDTALANLCVVELALAIRELRELLPAHHSTVVIDDEQWRDQLMLDASGIPFLERDRQYWGPPADDGQAIDDLRRLHREGADHLLICKPAFWWLTYYHRFYKYVQTNAVVIRQNERFVLFRLNRELNEERTINNET